MQTSLLQYFRVQAPPLASPVDPAHRGSKRTSEGRVKDDAPAPAPSSSASTDSESEWCATSSSDPSGDEGKRWTRRRRLASSQRPARTCKGPDKRPLLSPNRPAVARWRARPQDAAAHRPGANPFRNARSPVQRAKRPPQAPVFMRSPSSRRLRRLERTPVPARRLGLSPRSRPVHAPPFRGDLNSPAKTIPSAWADKSDSELSSVPSSMSSELDTPTHAPHPLAATAHDPKSPIQLPAGTEGPLSRAALQKHRRNSIVKMCEARQIPVPADATKPVLIDQLLGARPMQSSERKELGSLDLERLDLLDREIPADRLEKLEQIGSGAFKVVYMGRYHISRTKVTPVAISDLRDEVTEMDIKELKFLRDLCHENIVRFIGISIPPRPSPVPCMIVSELCENGDLFDYIRNTPPPPHAALFRLLLQIARGLEYLHTRTPTIVHRDCKSTNVLITGDGVAKIADFGLARVKTSARARIRSLVGTVNWQAPELWVPKPNYNEKVDVWSAAMTFWEVLQWHQPEKRYPFQGMNEHQIYLLVGQKKLRPFVGGIRRRYGGEIVDLLDAMWAQSPRDRPTMSQVCAQLAACIGAQELG
ncbi:Similar to S.cerevisiae protein KIC1 (Protein kinase of the PAK/Ste20 family, required for cell integrity) [Malassezia sympodialis ATCC 42132]|uniref:Similar to S.cerevisiae protein KIC1 (Protein kinase of the PAK/Ste20 family, required for cell integrity) n=2 Tax=Malassezia sympodialis (strain ATCC 42132) TaxID=1230383 RepID=A0A1M8A9G1_MALS4|nr:Similar to S.cerevisiae protein KIC1 (Protein kinase of the PAK/Ste20 family, required for cell integrity) [Malassezia sympodialis ATCC 42132]